MSPVAAVLCLFYTFKLLSLVIGAELNLRQIKSSGVKIANLTKLLIAGDLS